MNPTIQRLAAVAAGTLLATSAFAQSAKELEVFPGQSKTVTFTVPGTVAHAH
jgi:hypothetical protein